MTTSLSRRGGALAPLSVLACIAAGCAKPTGTVTDKVTLNGQPVPAAMIVFIYDKAPAVTTMSRSDGTVTLSNAPVGPARITVRTFQPGPPVVPPRGGAPGAPTVPQDNFVELPPRYAQDSTSGLAYTVEPGEQVHDLPLSP